MQPSTGSRRFRSSHPAAGPLTLATPDGFQTTVGDATAVERYGNSSDGGRHVGAPPVVSSLHGGVSGSGGVGTSESAMGLGGLIAPPPPSLLHQGGLPPPLLPQLHNNNNNNNNNNNMYSSGGGGGGITGSSSLGGQFPPAPLPYPPPPPLHSHHQYQQSYFSSNHGTPY